MHNKEVNDECFVRHSHLYLQSVNSAGNFQRILLLKNDHQETGKVMRFGIKDEENSAQDLPLKSHNHEHVELLLTKPSQFTSL